MKRRTLRKAHDLVLKSITTIASALVVLAAGCADTPGTNAPFIIAVASLAWLSLFCYANLGRRTRHEKVQSVR